MMETARTNDGQVIPLNRTTTNLLSTAGALFNATTAASKVFEVDDAGKTKTKSTLLIPTSIPSSPIYIKWIFGGVVSAASASNFDEVLTETYPAMQVDITALCTGFSIFSAVSQPIHWIQKSP